MKKGLFYAILASVLWAIVNPFIKQGLSYDFTPMNFAVSRLWGLSYSHIPGTKECGRKYGNTANYF